jgi:Ni/Co efflux regulator RcnB
MMSEITQPEASSRRSFVRFLGLAAAASLAFPAMALSATNADAQTQGMDRRDERRDDRQGRRDDRQSDRQERRSKKKKKAKK